jgi:membrane associated rhomboid family serine protease
MNDQIRGILKWAFAGGIAVSVVVVLMSSGMPLGIRVTCALMGFGGGLVTAALLAANFTHDEETESHGPPTTHAGH